MARQLPNQIHGHSGGNHKVAIDRTADIRKYVEQAVAQLEQARDESFGSFLRGGYLRQADETLNTIIRYAHCAKDELRNQYCPTYEQAE
jgi:hypothetical protein